MSQEPSAEAIAHAEEMMRWMQDDGREFHIKLASGLDAFAAQAVAAERTKQRERGPNEKGRMFYEDPAVVHPPTAERTKPDVTDLERADALIRGPLWGRFIGLPTYETYKSIIATVLAKHRRAAKAEAEIAMRERSQLPKEENEVLLRRLPDYIATAEKKIAEADEDYRSGDAIYWSGLAEILRDYAFIRALPVTTEPSDDP